MSKYPHIYSRLIIGSSSLLLFILLAILVGQHATFITSADHEAINLLHPLITPARTKFITIISNLASPTMMTVYSIIIALFLARKNQFRVGLNFLIFFSSFNLLNHIVKGWIERPRPTHRLITIGGFSFPSGHTFATIVLVFCILTLLKQSNCSQKVYLTATACGWGLILLIAFSRVFLHAHFLSDTIGSLFLATASWQIILSIIELRATHYNENIR
ncbi:phosphatase PAP2 family protein [Ligilactobacillus pobuzihii]|uniref:Phosphatidylglycerophosphatase B n=1 Tax=Ligilactobacillus pobuzihii TaxID=449659 RepID=A0A0R2L1I1_9LACO|nr:phosphatase PAP2 family protein [Ligilactobacillus pobuzihii]KRK09923.1 phosphatidylglycerophosphatase B [Ligilactobacillus pobuzihii E100301 = KCTC 13174]KRN95656.1 phosphatidylglycerophosphatase B [Ligilactobacillus pobuzihii]